MILGTGLGLGGCGGKTTPATESTTPAATPPEAVPPEAPAPEAAPPEAAPPEAQAAPPGPAPVPTPAPGGKNLKVLPASWSADQLEKFMKESVSPALGVKCNYCHDVNDFAKDNEKKEIARGMMKMTWDLNQKHFKGEIRVTCMTCHDGHEEPKGGG
jgi:hypothetical protein